MALAKKTSAHGVGVLCAWFLSPSI